LCIENTLGRGRLQRKRGEEKMGGGGVGWRSDKSWGYKHAEKTYF